MMKNMRHCKKKFTSSDYNQFTSEMLDAKMKEKESINKSDISGFIDKKIKFTNIWLKFFLLVKSSLVISQPIDKNFKIRTGLADKIEE